MKIIFEPTTDQWSQLCERPSLQTDFLENSVKAILQEVKTKGDKAIRELTFKFDNIQLSQLQVTTQELEEADNQISIELRKAIQTAYSNIAKFHATQRRETIYMETSPGVVCWRKATAIEKVGVYIPGGSAPLFSTVLMLGVPAQLAGCAEIVLCTPPDSIGKINPTILFAAKLCGIKKIFKVGGAQAVAALAYGTESIPKVYKILGPGNQYVTKAKQLIAAEGTPIDMPAGPSEVLVMADENANYSFVAADLLSQAEHGADSQVVLVSTDKKVVEKVLQEIQLQLPLLPRRSIAEKALEKSLAIVLNKNQAIEFVNQYAPEHLIINTIDCDILVEKIKNAGSIFLGSYTPESAGDYASGTNHTLPTNGFAKSYGGVSLESFLKYITVQKISKEGIKKLGPTIELMAKAEQLEGHAAAVRIRY